MRQFDEAPQELLHVDLSSHAPNFDAYNFFAEIIVVVNRRLHQQPLD